MKREEKITADFVGNVYVVDSGNNEIRKYTDEGVLIWSRFIASDIVDITVDPGGENVYVSDNQSIMAFDSDKGEEISEFDPVETIINDVVILTAIK